jgi:hypothetical protein
MFAHDLCHSQIEYLSNSTRREPLSRTIDLIRKDRAKRYHKSSIFNSGLSGLGTELLNPETSYKNTFIMYMPDRVNRGCLQPVGLGLRPGGKTAPTI